MNVIETDIPGVVVIEPRIFKDERGYFFEAFNEREFAEKVRPVHFVQDNESRSVKGVVRGLHFQKISSLFDCLFALENHLLVTITDGVLSENDIVENLDVAISADFLLFAVIDFGSVVIATRSKRSDRKHCNCYSSNTEKSISFHC